MATYERVEYIEHQAIVKEIDKEKNLLKVRIDDIEECGECPASKVCGSKGETSNLVEIKVPDVSNYKVYDIVTVRGSEQMHRRAILYTMVFPCILLIAIMIGIYLLTQNQLASALSGLGIIMVYYLMIWFLRNRLAHEFTFTVIGPIERAGEIK